MALSFKHSKSLGYRITQWFNIMQNLHESYNKQFNELFTNCLSRIYRISLDLQKTIDKDSKGVLRDKYNDIVSILDFHSTNLFELNELLLSYQKHLDKISDFEVEYQTIDEMKSILAFESGIINDFQLLARNLAKSGVPTFARKQSSKKKKDDFVTHMKSYISFVRGFNKEKPLRDESTQIKISELTDEIRITQERELAREKQDNTEEKNENKTNPDK